MRALSYCPTGLWPLVPWTSKLLLEPGLTTEMHFRSARVSAFLLGPERDNLWYWQPLESFWLLRSSQFRYSVWLFSTSATSLFIMSSFLPSVSSSALTSLNAVGMAVHGPVCYCQDPESLLVGSLVYFFLPVVTRGVLAPVHLVTCECRILCLKNYL